MVAKKVEEYDTVRIIWCKQLPFINPSVIRNPQEL